MQNNTIKDLQPEYRPYERFEAYGPGVLSDAELLAIILRTGSTELHSVDLARKILTPEGDDDTSILNIFNYDLYGLMKIRGIGKVKAIQILAIAELSLRISQSQARKSLVFNDSGTVARYYMEQLRHNKEEKVIMLLLDSACNLIKEYVVSQGTVNASLISAREIFITALRYEAVSFILMHNHPSGLPIPSSNDMQITLMIRQAGDLLGITMSDHIIIGDNQYFSFKESGSLNE